MTDAQTTHESVEMIPIHLIHVLNPRTRNRQQHRRVVENIQAVGLKRPIMLSRQSMRDGSVRYDLICGQGRLEAFQALNQQEIPAFVTDASQEECMLMSLVENIARVQHRPIDLMREVGSLKQRGFSDSQIAEKIGVTPSWVNMINGLLERGEEKLLAAVETGMIPLSMATTIARSGAEIQDLLSDAYEQGFKGRKLSVLRRLLEQRAKRAKSIGNAPLGRAGKRKKLTPLELRRIFEREAENQRLAAKRAEFTHDRLIFAMQAFKDILRNKQFVSILRSHKLDSLPVLLNERMASGERS
ncbi:MULTISPECIES: plasmid partitioning protein RepB C-terminal domain-containing protein [unclassified Variovorax]|uniref:plasmid partitioning protein RepB C-terminal domain-containing protein n=1 Tax=unclassified Variovorax TaxID=663243 RepID=UPI003F460A9B